ncbi:hypothetical protein B0H15DRAFT_853069 [Mycena belliarum]|uniref:Uncharacterized protein n=1 Tax=Mycena belliarum TaxID=1033014 RepID=A0AAD6U287_9AGAR|nr:hypothetical protein B0H15DRAFT_853069 [Mycena belliae]
MASRRSVRATVVSLSVLAFQGSTQCPSIRYQLIEPAGRDGALFLWSTLVNANAPRPIHLWRRARSRTPDDGRDPPRAPESTRTPSRTSQPVRTPARALPPRAVGARVCEGTLESTGVYARKVGPRAAHSQLRGVDLNRPSIDLCL